MQFSCVALGGGVSYDCIFKCIGTSEFEWKTSHTNKLLSKHFQCQTEMTRVAHAQWSTMLLFRFSDGVWEHLSTAAIGKHAVHPATEACCYRSEGRFYKGTLHTYTPTNCSLNVLLRDGLTAAHSIHPFLLCHSINISLFSLYLTLSSFSLLFSGCRCLILCIKKLPVALNCWIFYAS